MRSCAPRGPASPSLPPDAAAGVRRQRAHSTVATLRFDAGAPHFHWSTHVRLFRLDGPARIPGRHPHRTKRPDLYVSNRGHNSIAVFSVSEATGALALEQTVSTEGDWPRNSAWIRAGAVAARRQSAI